MRCHIWWWCCDERSYSYLKPMNNIYKNANAIRRFERPIRDPAILWWVGRSNAAIRIFKIFNRIRILNMCINTFFVPKQHTGVLSIRWVVFDRIEYKHTQYTLSLSYQSHAHTRPRHAWQSKLHVCVCVCSYSMQSNIIRRIDKTAVSIQSMY